MSATSTPQKAPLGDGQKFALGLAVTGMLAVGAYGLVISYWTVRELAVKLHMPLPHIFPVGIEGGMIAVLAIDIVLTWIGRPIGWLRQVARALSATAISINAYAGMEYGAAAVVMHALAPAILIVGVEALRHHLLVVLQVPEEREPIPRGRWLLAPLSSAAMGRRMVLWQQPRYTDALDTHLDRHEAIAELKRAFGWRWKKHIPAGLAYRLSVGVRLDESTAEVRALLAAHYARTEHTVSMMVAHEEQDARLALDAHTWREPVRVRTGERTHTVVGGDHVNGHLSPGARTLLPVRCAPRARVQDAHARGDAAVAALRGWTPDGARARITPVRPDASPASRARTPRMQDDQPEPTPARTDAHADAHQDEQDARPGPVDEWITEQGARGVEALTRFLEDGGDEGQGDARPAPAPDAPDSPTGAVLAARMRGDESRARILEYLRAHPDARPVDIAGEIGLSASQVRRQLKVIRDQT
ncbi:DUF2637 domain-containing protein [Nocardiopsis sp. TNDT3]|uniref:DUF2637 domain-containing protein n=1 Tax=Nocardiopsis sp. TNDT3 TaxID=2249354 RepID=UPI0018E4EE42|nr:DUF2637 domain-containing protein [Nocardiopsis sp. TNDT3]